MTAGTIFDKTRTPLTTWFETAWHLTTAKNGMSAQTLSHTMGTSYQVAWAMLHRYRVAMLRAEREPLRGDVEVDEIFVGGVDHGGKPGRGTRKCIVVIAVEIKQPKGFGRVRMRPRPRRLWHQPGAVRQRRGGARLGRAHRRLARLRRTTWARLRT